jgi:hypothetical protein
MLKLDMDPERLCRRLRRFGYVVPQKGSKLPTEEWIRIGLWRLEYHCQAEAADPQTAAQSLLEGRRCCMPDVPNERTARLFNMTPVKWDVTNI